VSAPAAAASAAAVVQISDHYMFFLRGFSEELWVTLPDVLRHGTAADTRPAGEGVLHYYLYRPSTLGP
jgi:hypothetical protein